MTKHVGAGDPMSPDGSTDEAMYDRARLTQWLAGKARGDGISRGDLMRLSAAAGLAVLPGIGHADASARSPATEGPIVKPLPPDLFYAYGSNAEMRWEAMRGQGHLVPIDRFFVRNHTETPLLDADSWRLRLFGSGLRGAPPLAHAIEFSYRDLLAMPAVELTAGLECAGNGRSFFTTQQNQSVPGTAWKLGAVGVARWRGVPLRTVLRCAGLTSAAVDIMPAGLDRDFVSGGLNLGSVRRPLPVKKALRDVLLAYEMNDERLPPDHGFPVRLVVPSWIGISSIKWLGQIEVSDRPLFSPWNTQFYRLLGPEYPTDGTVITRQVVKSAFELAPDARLIARRAHLLHGRSWSGNGRVVKVEVSTDGGVTWWLTKLTELTPDGAWQRWQTTWRPPAPGVYTLRARATDITGVTQPDVAPYNTLGYLFGAVVHHQVTVI